MSSILRSFVDFSESQMVNIPTTNVDTVENVKILLLPGCEPTVSTSTDNNLRINIYFPSHFKPVNLKIQITGTIIDTENYTKNILLPGGCKKIDESHIDINYFILNQLIHNVNKINFYKTGRKCGKYFRKLPRSIFTRTLHNGQTTNREKSSLRNLKYGLKNWGKCEEKVKCHEEDQVHGESIRIWFSRTQNSEIKSKLDYWTNVLHRVIATVTSLAERGLPFRGKNNEFGSVHNGNYMGSLELIAKFDPFLSGHISKYGNKGKGNVSYLSSIICDEFLSLMNNLVLKKIVIEIIEAKYFSIIVDSTPDISKQDQLTVVTRYIKPNGNSEERFLTFLSAVGHKVEQMEEALIDKFKELDIDIKNCRGQAYDNASNMSGKYNGLQARIKKYSKNANFVSCAAHSLNLIGSNAAEINKLIYLSFIFLIKLN
ncbi:hypothetical protein AGLY_007375 [Aphis glycines]|uniref:DUF4371 domain-containing protein n=1 Tax=Aphis glycines TaxID=307491 RepID=A0A6G0TQR3_APHGL|nr:hypothetical protein AGLY_007375 [Aphis glycines]